MFATLKQVTRFELDGQELLDVIQKETGHYIDGAQVSGDDSQGWLRINVSKEPIHQHDMDLYNEILAGRELKYYDAEQFYPVYLSLKCQAGLIPEGEYHVHFTWG